MEEMDLRGLACPGPVLELRKRLATGAAGLRLLVADELARSNVTRYARSRAGSVSERPLAGGGWEITIEGGNPLPPSGDGRPGAGDPERSKAPAGRRTAGEGPDRSVREDGSGANEAVGGGAVESAGGRALGLAPRYGGCGAKLARGELATILCGLPRLESDDLLVGIETADDAGVLRLDDDLALIHSVDFFPPVVDEPFAFGRIAAANALSDIYAMGGTPRAGMNIVSFPLARRGRERLRLILAGALDALAEAGAVLAGGHTLDGEEELFGLAVTGTVDPRRVWRNAGARDGDVLVLTKPLGTGLVTTAAAVGQVRPGALEGAVSSMSRLNAAAAAAVAPYDPAAVTDVTGFGLAGHAAEMAQASGLEVYLGLDALPVLPGALEAAGEGMVPLGAARNRESLEGSLVVEEGCDPLRVDLAFDPQTSGGLLAACRPEAAEKVLRALPAARIVGRCARGEPGRVVLARAVRC